MVGPGLQISVEEFRGELHSGVEIYWKVDQYSFVVGL